MSGYIDQSKVSVAICKFRVVVSHPDSNFFNLMVRLIAIDFISGQMNKGASGHICLHVSSRLSVPPALTSKSSNNRGCLVVDKLYEQLYQV